MSGINFVMPRSHIHGSPRRFYYGLNLTDDPGNANVIFISLFISTTPDPGYQWENDKLTVRYHKREQRGQPFPSRRPQSTYKQTCTKT